MSSLRLWFKMVLFFSSYTPLFLILLFRNFAQNGTNLLEDTADTKISWIIILFILFGNCLIYFYLRKREIADNPRTITVTHKEDLNHLYIEYLMAYIIPFVAFDYANAWDIASIFVLLLVVCFLFINSDLLYVNVMVNLFGYDLFKINDTNENVFLLIKGRKEKLSLNQTIKINTISENFVIEARGDDNARTERNAERS